jgi:hypothetical protein
MIVRHIKELFKIYVHKGKSLFQKQTNSMIPIILVMIEKTFDNEESAS